MAGIYIHIPFCRKLCHYCDFYKQISLTNKEAFLGALKTEISLRKGYLKGEIIETIYFGGGTPSVLEPIEIEDILSCIYSLFSVCHSPEITLEANPDDLDKSYLSSLYGIGINRLSIGVQSFDNKVLKFLNRRHTGEQALDAVKVAQSVGFDNISLDIIYGIPETNIDYLVRNLYKLCSLNAPHVSIYHLTIEQGTQFGKLYDKGKILEITEDDSAEQYQLLIEHLEASGYEQYELSNFCKSSFVSRHNANYWNQVPYIGIGASAHSYNGESRQWNIANMNKYINALNQNNIPCEKEYLSEEDKFNDFLMVHLRTIKGVNLVMVNELFGKDKVNYIKTVAERFITDFDISDTTIRIKKSSFLRSDYLIAQFFVF